MRAIDSFATLTANQPQRLTPSGIKHIESETYTTQAQLPAAAEQKEAR